MQHLALRVGTDARQELDVAALDLDFADPQSRGLDPHRIVLQRAGQQNLMTSGQSLLEAVSRHQGEAPG